MNVATRVPAIPASVAAIVMIAGLGLLYFALTGLGILTTGSGPKGTGNAGGSIVEKLPPSGGKPGAKPGEGLPGVKP